MPHSQRPTDQTLGMFAKVPRPGQVKTRLAVTLGDNTAAHVYGLFLRQLLARLTPLRYCKSLVHWPAGEGDYFSDFAEHGWRVEPQSPGDLGTRMGNFFQLRFAAEDRQVVLIGSDSPDLPLEMIESAFSHLERTEVVLGPSHDGGYYLIGMSKFHLEIFQDMPWSTSEVLAETVARLQRGGTSHVLLDPWYDVDDGADLEDLLTRLTHDSVQCPELQALREELIRSLAARQ
ncbi:MAG: TIGR04282 family arsenosugar biosynthesis glycosyltransferase [Pirellulaceae bacterium]